MPLLGVSGHSVCPLPSPPCQPLGGCRSSTLMAEKGIGAPLTATCVEVALTPRVLWVCSGSGSVPAPSGYCLPWVLSPHFSPGRLWLPAREVPGEARLPTEVICLRRMNRHRKHQTHWVLLDDTFASETLRFWGQGFSHRACLMGAQTRTLVRGRSGYSSRRKRLVASWLPCSTECHGHRWG